LTYIVRHSARHHREHPNYALQLAMARLWPPQATDEKNKQYLIITVSLLPPNGYMLLAPDALTLTMCIIIMAQVYGLSKLMSLHGVSLRDAAITEPVNSAGTIATCPWLSRPTLSDGDKKKLSDAKSQIHLPPPDASEQRAWTTIVDACRIADWGSRPSVPADLQPQQNSLLPGFGV
jgi:hypothetical protein